MTESERLADLLLNEVRPCGEGPRQPTLVEYREALCRAIERHEVFRQEVSDAIVFALKVYGGHSGPLDPLRRFIIPKPDPLVEACRSAPYLASNTELAAHIRTSLDKDGFEIREKANG